MPDEVVASGTTAVPDEAAPIRVVEGPDSCIMDGFDRWGQLRRSAARPSESGWDALDGYFTMFRERVQTFKVSPPGSDWDGVERRLTK